MFARVELSMHESVEVYMGDLAEIPCQYNFTDTDDEHGFYIQWFVVSPAGPT